LLAPTAAAGSRVVADIAKVLDGSGGHGESLDADRRDPPVLLSLWLSAVWSPACSKCSSSPDAVAVRVMPPLHPTLQASSGTSS
jgi:hypothetical protein